MSTITEFSRRVEELEQAAAAACPEARLAAIGHLIDNICAQPWQEHDERSAAQDLICRLVKLQRAGERIAATADQA